MGIKEPILNSIKNKFIIGSFYIYLRLHNLTFEMNDDKIFNAVKHFIFLF